MTESLYVVNEKDKIVDIIQTNEIHQKNLLHRSVHIFIVNSSGKLFCRQISFKSFVYPGYWSTSVGAHVFSNETYGVAAKKIPERSFGN